jgi:hypothetical protein
MRTLIACFCVLAMFVVEARAERPTSLKSDAPTISPGEVKATPEMWFYEQQMRRYNDPKAGVRANAEYRANQRQARVESMKWFGFSNSRPQVVSDPFSGDNNTPHWTSNSSMNPSRWNAVGQTSVYTLRRSDSSAE